MRVTNQDAIRLAIPGYGGLMPGDTADVPDSPEVRELARRGLLRIKPEPKQRTRKQSDRPDSEPASAQTGQEE